MVKIEINAIEFLVKNNISVLEACKFVGIYLPRFCYHEILSVSGNCRMCLIEINGMPKPMTACALPVLANMKIWLNSPMVRKARENVLEALLLQHPLDCPICDQGGECDLQDQARTYGSDRSRNMFNKRGVEDKFFNTLILGIMTRCIHCTRCVRFNTEIAGNPFLGTLNRGGSTEIGSYHTSLNEETFLNGNLIDLCPVGALTSKFYSFKARPWELKSAEAFDLTDGLGCNIYINFKETEIVRVLPKINATLNGSIISDKARFFFDSLITHRVFNGYRKMGGRMLKLSKLEALQELERFINCLNFSIILFSAENQFELFLLLQHLTYKYNDLLTIKTVTQKIHKENLKVDLTVNISDTLLNSDLILLISTNLQIENCILNSKLRSKVLYSNSLVYSVNTSLNLSNSTNFINFMSCCLTQILKGKAFTLSGYKLLRSTAFFFFGESWFLRYKDTNQILFLLKKFIPNLMLVNVRTLSNSFGLEKTPIKSVVKKDFKNINFLILLNIIDDIKIAKNLYQNKTFFSVLNSFGSRLARLSNLIVPVSTVLEGGSHTFFNMEGRNQNLAIKIIPFEFKIAPYTVFDFCYRYRRRFLELDLYYIKNNKLNLIFFTRKFTMIYNPCLFSLFYTYPAKPTINDFFLTGLFTQTSQTLSKMSQIIRKSSTNF